jgi:hypothetical protein
MGLALILASVMDSRAEQESGLLGVLGSTCRHPTCGY